MASKYYTTAHKLLTDNGMPPEQATTVARLASGYVSASGLLDVGAGECSAKMAAKKFTAKVEASVSRDLKKGELLKTGEVAFGFVSTIAAHAKAWPGTLRGLSIPTGLARAHETLNADADDEEAAKADSVA
jgi:hypothetical protein